MRLYRTRLPDGDDEAIVRFHIDRAGISLAWDNGFEKAIVECATKTNTIVQDTFEWTGHRGSKITSWLPQPLLPLTPLRIRKLGT